MTTTMLVAWLLIFQIACGETQMEQYGRQPSTVIAQGPIIGKLMISKLGRKIAAFRGIPYAKPPINELRFKMPVSAEPWEGVFKADTDETISCPQMSNNKVIGTEDCLLLNVYTQSIYLRNTSKLPVMFYIHGGGFTKGSGMDPMYSPAMLLDKDLVLVTINHRLGILGFLSSGDEVIPGNLGLFDQTEALKWVQNNIEAFGGDADKVTIFGQSSGSIAVSLHLVSPRSKNLFSGAILQSGTFLGTSSFDENPRKLAKRLAMKMKCPSTSSEELLNCLMSKSTEQLVTAPEPLYMVNELPKLFRPAIDNRPEGFFPNNPHKVLSTELLDIPVMIGITKEEGYYVYSVLEKYFDQNGQQEFMKCDLPTILQGFHQQQIQTYVPHLIENYFRNVSQQDDEQFHNALISLYGDLYNVEGIQRMTEMLPITGSTTYVYKLSYRGDVCHPTYNCSKAGNRGPSHSEDLPFMFPYQILNAIDSQVSDQILKLWSNFAQYRNPTPNDNLAFKWLPMKANEPNYLDINLTPKMVDGKLTDKVNEWMEIVNTKDNCMEI